VGGRLGASGVIPTIGARTVWAAMLGDMRSPRRPMARGGQCVGECGLATWRPLAVVNVTHRSTPAQRIDQSGPSACTRREYGAYGGTDDVSCPSATSCTGARVLHYQFDLPLFYSNFL
jgi:hypothetical protein